MRITFLAFTLVLSFLMLFGSGEEKEVHLKVVGKPLFRFVVRKADFLPRGLDYSTMKKMKLPTFIFTPTVEGGILPYFGTEEVEFRGFEKRYEHVHFVSMKEKPNLRADFNFEDIYKNLSLSELEKMIEFGSSITHISIPSNLERYRTEFFHECIPIRAKRVLLPSSFTNPVLARFTEKSDFKRESEMVYEYTKKFIRSNLIALSLSNEGFGGRFEVHSLSSEIGMKFWDFGYLSLFLPMGEGDYKFHLAEDVMNVGILSPNLDFETSGTKIFGNVAFSLPMKVMNLTVDVGVSAIIWENGVIPLPTFSTSFPVGDGYMIISSKLNGKYEATAGIKYGAIFLNLSGGYSFPTGSYSFNLDGGYVGNSFGFSIGFGSELNHFFGKSEVMLGPFSFSRGGSLEAEIGFKMMEDLENSEVKFGLMVNNPLGLSNLSVGGFVGVSGGRIRYGGDIEIGF